MDEFEEAVKRGEPCAVVHFDKNGNVTHEERYNLDKVCPSDYQIKSLAKCFLPHIREFFSTEEGQRKYEEWRAKKPSSQSYNDEEQGHG